MNFYFEEIPLSKLTARPGFTKTDFAYSCLEDLFIFLGFPDKTLLKQLRSYFVPLIVNKRTKLLNANEVTDKIFFIAKGAVRVYSFDENTNEQKTQLLLTEGNLVTCLKGFIERKQPERNIITAENSILLYISYDNFQRMLKELPGTLTVLTNALSRKIVFQQELAAILKDDTKNKFEYLQNRLNEVYKRFPLKYQASYLGIKPETLSRIRGIKMYQNKNRKMEL